MIDKDAARFENLKIILKNIRNPELLDDHPWVQSLVVQEALAGSSQLELASPGQQLVSAIARLFSNMQPPAPPRHGKRLDPRWGEFGLLAALYFTPFTHGTPFPTSLLEAWERIDTAVLYHVYEKPVESLTEAQIQRYQLVGTEIEYGSASTLSDWHKKGLQRLVDILLDRERYLSKSSSKPSVILDSNGRQAAALETADHRLTSIRKRSLWLVAGLMHIGFGN